MTNSHALVKLKLTTQCESLCHSCFFAFLADVACIFHKLFMMIKSAAFHTRSKQPFGLEMCYFVYKVITNKVFKKVTCQLLGWWIPFPQWKHASAEASNFLNCTPPKLQCRDCLVINRGCTVPSLCMRLCRRERVRGEAGIPSNAPDYRPRFQYWWQWLHPPPQRHLTDHRPVGFSVSFFQELSKKKKIWRQVYNVGLIWDVVSLIFYCWNLSVNWPTEQTDSQELLWWLIVSFIFKAKNAKYFDVPASSSEALFFFSCSTELILFRL